MRRPFTRSERTRYLDAANFACEVCGWTSTLIALEIHHVVPVRRGGTDEPQNLVVLCPNHHGEADHLNRVPGLVRSRSELLRVLQARHRERPEPTPTTEVERRYLSTMAVFGDEPKLPPVESDPRSEMEVRAAEHIRIFGDD